MFTITRNGSFRYRNENVDEAMGVLRAYLATLQGEGWVQESFVSGPGCLCYELHSPVTDENTIVKIERTGR